jgi:hypothetical protein
MAGNWLYGSASTFTMPMPAPSKEPMTMPASSSTSTGSPCRTVEPTPYTSATASRPPANAAIWMPNTPNEKKMPSTAPSAAPAEAPRMSGETQRVAEQALEGRTGHRQCRAHRDGGECARAAHLQHDGMHLIVGRGSALQHRPQQVPEVGQGDVNATLRERQQHTDQQNDHRPEAAGAHAQSRPASTRCTCAGVRSTW